MVPPPCKKYLKKFGYGKTRQGVQEGANKRAEIWRSTIKALVGEGFSNTAIAKMFNSRGEPSVSGSGQWTAKGVSRLRARLAA